MTEQRETEAKYDLWHAARVAEDDEPRPEAPWHLMARKHLGDVSGFSVLEIGCGRGAFARYLAEQGAHVIAGDFSPVACEETHKLCGELVDVRRLDAQNLAEPLGRERFDMVVSLETLEHVPDHNRALREIVAVTKPGGRILISTPNYVGPIGLHRAALRILYLLSLTDSPFTEYGQPHNNVMVGFMRPLKLRRLGCRIDVTEGAVHQLPIPGRSGAIPLPFLDRRAFRYLATHVFVAATKR